VDQLLNLSTLGFFVGLLSGLILGYLARDVLRVLARLVRRLLFRPQLLSSSRPGRQRS